MFQDIVSYSSCFVVFVRNSLSLFNPNTMVYLMCEFLFSPKHPMSLCSCSLRLLLLLRITDCCSLCLSLQLLEERIKMGLFPGQVLDMLVSHFAFALPKLDNKLYTGFPAKQKKYCISQVSALFSIQRACELLEVE